MICDFRKNLCQKPINEKGKLILKVEMFETSFIAGVFVLNNTVSMCTYAFVCRRQTFPCVLARKALLKLCVLHNSVFRVHNLYTRHSFHPCSLHFISRGFNECKNKKTAEQPGAVIMSVFISKVRLGLFSGGWKNLMEKKGQ